MKNIKRHHHLLSLLAHAKPSQRAAILKTATSSQVKCLCEICKNVLCGNVPVSVSKLKKYKSTIREVAQKSTNLNRKRKLLCQKGGFLPLILPAIISLLTGK